MSTPPGTPPRHDPHPFAPGLGPLPAGGLLIGCGVALLYLFTGRVGGVSTVFSSSWSYLSRLPCFQQARFIDSRAWRRVYALGLVLGAALWWWGWGPGVALSTAVPVPQLLLGGLLVGYGARRANSCTSGHDICGLGALQFPSLVAVLTFMATAFLTANAVLHLTEKS